MLNPEPNSFSKLIDELSESFDLSEEAEQTGKLEQDSQLDAGRPTADAVPMSGDSIIQTEVEAQDALEGNLPAEFPNSGKDNQSNSSSDCEEVPVKANAQNSNQGVEGTLSLLTLTRVWMKSRMPTKNQTPVRP